GSFAPPSGRDGSDPLLKLFELLDGHEHRSRLRAFRWPDDPLALEEVHEPPGAGEPHPQLALEHARRPQPAADDELHGLVQQLFVLVDVVGGAAAALVAGDPVDVLGLWDLTAPVPDDLADALLVDPRPLDALGPARRGGDEQHVALADELVGAGL